MTVRKILFPPSYFQLPMRNKLPVLFQVSTVHATAQSDTKFDFLRPHTDADVLVRLHRSTAATDGHPALHHPHVQPSRAEILRGVLGTAALAPDVFSVCHFGIF